MRGVFEEIKIEISGKSYTAKGEVTHVRYDPTVINHRVIIIDNDESIYPELNSFINDELYDINDIQNQNTFTGRYRYVGSNYKHHIFEDTKIV